MVERLSGDNVRVTVPNGASVVYGTTTPLTVTVFLDPKTSRAFSRVTEVFDVSMVDGRVRLEQTRTAESPTFVWWYDGSSTTVTSTWPRDGSGKSGAVEGIVYRGQKGMPVWPWILECYRFGQRPGVPLTVTPQTGGAFELRYTYESGYESYKLDPARNYAALTHHDRQDENEQITTFGDFKQVGGLWLPGSKRVLRRTASEEIPNTEETVTYRDIRILPEAEGKAILAWQPDTGVNFDPAKRKFAPPEPAFTQFTSRFPTSSPMSPVMVPMK